MKYYLSLYVIVIKNYKSSNTIKFPHSLFNEKRLINFENINSVFLIFETVFCRNHLDNVNYKIPINFKSFKKNILYYLKGVA